MPPCSSSELINTRTLLTTKCSGGVGSWSWEEITVFHWQIDAMISDNDSDNFKYHDDEERRELSCNDGITVIHSLNQTHWSNIKDLWSVKSGFCPTIIPADYLTNSLYIFSPELWHQAVVTGQDPGRCPGRPGYAIREIFWFIILVRVSTLSCPPLAQGLGAGRHKKTIDSKLLAREHWRRVMCVAQKVIIDLWLRKIGVRFVANLCESHKQMNIYQQMTFGQT